MCERRAEIRASGAEELASIFHVSRTNLDPPARLLYFLVLRSVLGGVEVESRGIHLSNAESKLCQDCRIGVESVWSGGRGRSCHHLKALFLSLERISMSVYGRFLDGCC